MNITKIKSLGLFAIAACLILSSTSFAANDQAEDLEYCKFRLLSFSANGVQRWGFTKENVGFESDSMGNISVLDITDVINMQIGKSSPFSGDATKDQNKHREKLYSRNTQRQLGEVRCYLDKTPAEIAKREIKVNPRNLLPPIFQSENTLLAVTNFKSHAEALDFDEDDFIMYPKPVVFSGAFDDIKRPRLALLDPEVEMGVVVRKNIEPGTVVTDANYKEYVAGFVLTNDVSNRVPIIMEKGDGGFTAAKSSPTFLPVGPFFVPIEYFDLPEGQYLPETLLTTTVSLSEAQEKRSEGKEILSQIALSKDSAYFAKVIDILNWSLENPNTSDKAIDGKTYKILKDGRFVAGDLILMGTPEGTAVEMMDKVQGFRNGARKTVSMYPDFWQEYGHVMAYAPNDDMFSNGPHGGPWPLNRQQGWMGVKLAMVANEYCLNTKYLREGDSVFLYSEVLGTQFNKVVNALPGTEPTVSELDEAAICKLSKPDAAYWTGYGVSGASLLGEAGTFLIKSGKARWAARVALLFPLIGGAGYSVLEEVGDQSAEWGEIHGPAIKVLRGKLSSALSPEAAQQVVEDIFQNGYSIDDALRPHNLNEGKYQELDLLISETVASIAASQE